MHAIITFILRMFEAAFYSLIFFAPVCVAAAVIAIKEKDGEKHDG